MTFNDACEHIRETANSYGFEVSRDFYNKACEQMLGQAEMEET